MSKFSHQSFCEFDQFYSVMIADDGRVAYAYFMQGEDAVSDVWLYNQAEAPKISFWNTEECHF